MDNAAILWLIALIVFLTAEFFTVMLVSVWLALGAFAAMLSALFGVPPAGQIVIFLVVSALSLLATRPFVRKIRSKRVSTNADRSIGRMAAVTETIDNVAGRGAVRVDGKEWTARAAGGEIIDAGSTVLVLRIEGVKLIVSPSARAVEAGIT
jgi:membrane protein implicated in regulation of membrane protease activity